MNSGRDATGQLGSYSYSGGERSIGEILKEIVANTQDLIRTEIRLAKIELSEEGKKAIQASAMLVFGAVCGLLAFAFLCVTAMFALELVMPAWAAALVVGLILCILTAAGVFIGRGRLKALKAPAKTMQTMKEDVQWMKEQPKS